jgi:hypothetical protein
MPRGFIRALALIKQAAAETNAELGILPPDIAAAIVAAADEVAELALDDQLRQVLMAERLGRRPAGVARGGEVTEDVIVEEMGERTVADVVEQAGHAERLDHEPLGRRAGSRLDVGQGRPQRRVQVAGPQPGLVHDAQAVGEPAVLGGREDPARALELADPA